MHCFATCPFHLAIHFRNWSMLGQWQLSHSLCGGGIDITAFSLLQTLIRRSSSPFPDSVHPGNGCGFWKFHSCLLASCSLWAAAVFAEHGLFERHLLPYLTHWLCCAGEPLQAGMWLLIDGGWQPRNRLVLSGQIFLEWAHSLTAWLPNYCGPVSSVPYWNQQASLCWDQSKALCQLWQLSKIRMMRK